MAQDYIMRLIEQVGQMLASILRLCKAGRHEEAGREIDSCCWQTIGMSVEKIRRASPETIARLLEQCGPARHARAIVLAELLLQDAELCDRAGNLEDALLSRLHAFCLLVTTIELLDLSDRAIYTDKLDALTRALAPFKHDSFIAERLDEYAVLRPRLISELERQPSGLPG